MRPTETRVGVASSSFRATFAGDAIRPRSDARAFAVPSGNTPKAIVGSHQALHDLVHSAIAAAGQDRVVSLTGCLLSHESWLPRLPW